MHPELGLAWFRLALFITLVSAALIPFQQRDSAEFVISVIAFVIGLSFIVVIVVLVKRSR